MLIKAFKQSFIVLGFMMSVSAWCLAGGLRPDGGDRPNVVLIVADDLGWRELGCYGQEKIRTPSIDRLGSEGMRFTRFYSGSPVCAPSRCTLMTGKHTGHAAIRDNREVKPEGQEPLAGGEVTLPEVLNGLGYATGGIGKWGLGMVGTEGDPNRQGLDLFYGYHCQRHAHNHYPRYLRRNGERIELEGNTGGATGAQYSNDLFEEEALRFVRERKDRPFFLYLPLIIPHLALQVPEDALAEYWGKWEDPPYTGGKGYLPHPAPRAAYAAMVTRMDWLVGRVVGLIDELGLTDRTMIVFTSDNGPTYDRLGGSDSDFFGSAGDLRGRKGSVYEGGIRVPLIVRWAGKVRPGTTAEVGYFPDVLPTILELVGGLERLPAGVDGVSLAPVLLGENQRRKTERCLYWEFASYGGQQAVRVGDWKGVRQNLARGETRIELYDLASDPNEQKDVAGEHPEKVAELERRMREEHTPSALFPLPAVDGSK